MTPQQKKTVGIVSYLGLTGLIAYVAYRVGAVNGQQSASLSCAGGVNPCAARALNTTLDALQPFAPKTGTAITQTAAGEPVYVLWTAWAGAVGHPFEDSDVAWKIAGWGSWNACVNKKRDVYDELYPVYLTCIRKQSDPPLTRGRSVACLTAPA